MWRVDDPPCDKHFQNPGHKFNEHAKFAIIEKITHLSPAIETKSFRIQKIFGYSKTLSPKGLNIP